MNTLVRFSVCVLSAALFLPLLSGCSSGFKVTGKLVQDGKPITVSDKGMVHMSFISTEDKDGTHPYPVSTEKDGSFVVNARGDGTTPTAGKYRVSVRLFDPYPGNDKFGDKFSPQTSKIVKEVKGDGEIIVDVSKDG